MKSTLHKLLIQASEDPEDESILQRLARELLRRNFLPLRRKLEVSSSPAEVSDSWMGENVNSFEIERDEERILVLKVPTNMPSAQVETICEYLSEEEGKVIVTSFDLEIEIFSILENE